jgi:hypothetical protein
MSQKDEWSRRRPRRGGFHFKPSLGLTWEGKWDKANQTTPGGWQLENIRRSLLEIVIGGGDGGFIASNRRSHPSRNVGPSRKNGWFKSNLSYLGLSDALHSPPPVGLIYASSMLFLCECCFHATVSLGNYDVRGAAIGLGTEIRYPFPKRRTRKWKRRNGPGHVSGHEDILPRHQSSSALEGDAGA